MKGKVEWVRKSALSRGREGQVQDRKWTSVTKEVSDLIGAWMLLPTFDGVVNSANCSGKVVKRSMDDTNCLSQWSPFNLLKKIVERIKESWSRVCNSATNDNDLRIDRVYY